MGGCQNSCMLETTTIASYISLNSWNLYVFFWVLSPASDCSLPTFRNPLSVPSSRARCRVWSMNSDGKTWYLYPSRGQDQLVLPARANLGPGINTTSSHHYSYFILYIQPLKMEPIEGSETSANYNRTPGKYPKEYIQYSKHGESLKSRTLRIDCQGVVCLKLRD